MVDCCDRLASAFIVLDCLESWIAYQHIAGGFKVCWATHVDDLGMFFVLQTGGGGSLPGSKPPALMDTGKCDLYLIKWLVVMHYVCNRMPIYRLLTAQCVSFVIYIYSVSDCETAEYHNYVVCNYQSITQ